jgi:hypothetical protein
LQRAAQQALPARAAQPSGEHGAGAQDGQAEFAGDVENNIEQFFHAGLL